LLEPCAVAQRDVIRYTPMIRPIRESVKAETFQLRRLLPFSVSPLRVDERSAFTAGASGANRLYGTSATARATTRSS
jgi:hypothetical protein